VPISNIQLSKVYSEPRSFRGVGKTHLPSSLGYSLIEAGTRVKFYSASALVQQLQEAKQSLKLEDALNKLDKYPELIINDVSYVEKNRTRNQCAV
jgi:DNA replication protein DnaC